MTIKSIRGYFISFEDLIFRLTEWPSKQQTLIVGVDGCTGAGKSAFVNKLLKIDKTIIVVHMQDFTIPLNHRDKEELLGRDNNKNFDWERLRDQLLIPLAKNKEGKYQRYDIKSDTLKEWIRVPIGGVVLIEGIYSMRREIFEYYDYRIFVECDDDERISRFNERNRGKVDVDEALLLNENKYVAVHKLFDKADLVIDSTGSKGRRLLNL